jgi:hypothetical protein
MRSALVLPGAELLHDVRQHTKSATKLKRVGDGRMRIRENYPPASIRDGVTPMREHGCIIDA